MVEKGRERVNNQVTMARVIGEFAVTQGSQEAAKLVKQVTDTLTGLGIFPPTSPARQAAPPTPAPEVAVSGNGKAAADVAGPQASSENLAIPGYASLSASQVVQ